MPRVKRTTYAGYAGFAAAALTGMLSSPSMASATSNQPEELHRLAREILSEIVAIRTVAGTDNMMEAAETLATRLKNAGFPADDVRIVGPADSPWNLVVRWRGNGTARRPLLLLAHLDVVDALREDWSVDPFTLIEQDGFLYGRGTTDNKAGVAKLVAIFIRLRHEEFVPNRDLVMVITGDEETTQNGIQWLMEPPQGLTNAGLALNTDAGFGDLDSDGRRVRLSLQASEKVYLNFQLEVINKGGHSSRPTEDNAIYRLAEGLTRLAEYSFPVVLNEVTRAFFQKSAERAANPVVEDMRAVLRVPLDPTVVARLSKSPYYNANLRTTCVATMVSAGHAENALPQTARALVNCRILPGESVDAVEGTLRSVVADDEVMITRLGEATPSPPSPLSKGIVATIERLAAKHFPGVPVVPVMSTGATDGMYVRKAGVPTYGIGAIFEDPDEARSHGQDERVDAEAFYDAVDYWYDMIKAFSSE